MLKRYFFEVMSAWLAGKKRILFSEWNAGNARRVISNVENSRSCHDNVKAFQLNISFDFFPIA